MKDTEAAWLAGYIDGDGCVSIHNQTNREFKRLVISIDSTDLCLLERVKQLTGTGTIVAKKKSQDHHSQAYSWRAGSAYKVIEILETILPYLQCPSKIGRARLVVENWRRVTPKNGKYTEEMKIEKREFEEKFLEIGSWRGYRNRV